MSDKKETERLCGQRARERKVRKMRRRRLYDIICQVPSCLRVSVSVCLHVYMHR